MLCMVAAEASTPCAPGNATSKDMLACALRAAHPWRVWCTDHEAFRATLDASWAVAFWGEGSCSAASALRRALVADGVPVHAMPFVVATTTR